MHFNPDVGGETRELNQREASSFVEENDRESSVRSSGSCNFAELVSPLKRSVNLPGASDLFTANVYFISVDLPEEERHTDALLLSAQKSRQK